MDTSSASAFFKNYLNHLFINPKNSQATVEELEIRELMSANLEISAQFSTLLINHDPDTIKDMVQLQALRRSNRRHIKRIIIKVLEDSFKDDPGDPETNVKSMRNQLIKNDPNWAHAIQAANQN